MLTLTGSDPLDSLSWSKSATPVFESGNGIYAPGHGSFTTSPDGTENWVVYHTAKYSGSGWDREVRMQKFTIDNNDYPLFGDPVSDDTVLQKPGRSNDIHMEAEEAIVNKGRTIYSASGSGNKKVGYLDFADSWIEFPFYIENSGFYEIKIVYANGTEDNGNPVSSEFLLTANNDSSKTLQLPYTGWGSWSQIYNIQVLPSGKNVIRINKSLHYSEFDYIEIREVGLANGMKVYYNFDDNYSSGSILTNKASLLGSDVAVGNGNTWDTPAKDVNGLVNSALDCSSHVNANMPPLKLGGEVTVNFFLKLSGNGNGWERIFTTDNHWDQNKGFSITLVDNSELKFGFPGWSDVSADITMVQDSWQHFAVSFSDVNNRVCFYQNGVKIKEASTLLSIGATDKWSSFARALWDNNQDFLQGIDEVAIHNRVLSDDEVKVYYDYFTNL